MATVVSIIIPVYNAEKYIARCIGSILDQTYKDFELLIVDDGSTDTTASICDSFIDKDHRINVFHKKNGGEATARNFGIENAKGTYIQFVDADDYIDKTLTEELVYAASMNNSDAVMCGIKYTVIRNGDIISQKTNSLPEETSDLSGFLMHYKEYMPLAIIGASWNKLYKKDIITSNNIKYNVSVKNNLDTHFNYEYLNRCNVISTVKNSYYYYVDENTNSVSCRFIPDLFEVYLDTHLKAVKFLKDNNSYENNKIFSNTYFLKLVIGSMINIVNSDSETVYKNKILKLRNMCTNKFVMSAIAESDIDGIDKKLIIQLMKLSAARLIYFALKCRKMLGR